jgi:hypothetical protein
VFVSRNTYRRLGGLTTLEISEISLYDVAPTGCIDASIPKCLWISATLCIDKHDSQRVDECLTPYEEIKEKPSCALEEDKLEEVNGE